MSVETLVAIPAFDEAGTIDAVVSAAREHAPVLVVDDGSTDGTADIARAAGASVIRHERRQGKGAALATALTAARARGATRVVTLDADGQHDPRDVPTLVALASTAPRAIIVGTRLGDDAPALPGGRAVAIRVTGFWLNWITGAAVADTQSGFRVYPVALFDEVCLRGGRFVFETAVLAEALRRGWSVVEVPIRVVPRAARASRFHPLIDGAAVSVYLSRGALARWGSEIADGLREVLRVFTHERRTARHARVLGKAAAHAGTTAWALAVGIAVVDEVQGGTTSWWHATRARRARRAALATLGMPALLIGAGVAAITGGPGIGLLERLVRALYDQDALPPLTKGEERVPESRPWIAASR